MSTIHMQAGLPGLIGVPAIQLALAQWTSCAVVPGGNSVGDPSGPWPDLCGYAQRVYQPAFSLADLQACACTVTVIASCLLQDFEPVVPCCGLTLFISGR